MEKPSRVTRRQFVSTAAALAGGALIPNLAARGASAARVDGPVVFWTADPVGPGQTLLLFGDGLGSATVRGARLSDDRPGFPSAPVEPPRGGEELTLAQSNTECLKATIPAEWRPGVYAVWVDQINKPIYANRA